MKIFKSWVSNFIKLLTPFQIISTNYMYLLLVAENHGHGMLYSVRMIYKCLCIYTCVYDRLSDVYLQSKAVKSHHLWTLYICSFHFLLLANTIKYNVRLDLKRFSTQVYKYWRYWLYCCYYAIFYVPAILSYFKHVKTLFKEKSLWF